MAYQILYRGVQIQCESLDEAVAMAERLGGGLVGSEDGAGQNHGRGVVEGRWTVSRFQDFTGRLSEPQRNMLQELVRNSHGRTAKDLAHTLALSTSKSFGPLLAAMSKHAKKAGVRMEDVLSSERVDLGDEKMLEFRAAGTFARIAGEAGWRTSR